MQRSAFRKTSVVAFPLLALAAVALSSGQQPKPAAGGGSSAGSTTGSAGSTSGTTGSTSGGSTGGASAGWQLSVINTGTTTRSGTSVTWSGGTWHVGADGGGNAATTSFGPSSNSANSSGSVGLRLDWVGGSPKPAYGWVLVTSTAHWASTNGGGSASNAFGDPPQGNAMGQTATGKRVFRFTDGASRSWSIGASFTLSLATGQDGDASEACNVHGELTDKSATLAYPGNTSIVTDGNAYTADTLLSWGTSDGVSPGPNTQSLTGAYDGTWSKKADGTNDVSVVWSGASTGGFSPTPNNLTPSTYPPSPGGTMPYADGTGSKKTQAWKYSVRDNVDGSEIDLTFHWICHYAYEDFAENAGLSADATSTTSKVYAISLAAGASGMAHVDADSLPAQTHFISASWTSIPGFAPSDKHVGIPAYLARAGKTAPNAWSAQDVPVTANQGAGDYGVLKVLTWPCHVGDAMAWNAKGDYDLQTFRYFLDTDSHLDSLPYFHKAGEGM